MGMLLFSVTGIEDQGLFQTISSINFLGKLLMLSS